MKKERKKYLCPLVKPHLCSVWYYRDGKLGDVFRNSSLETFLAPVVDTFGVVDSAARVNLLDKSAGVGFGRGGENLGERAFLVRRCAPFCKVAVLLDVGDGVLNGAAGLVVPVVVVEVESVASDVSL